MVGKTEWKQKQVWGNGNIQCGLYKHEVAWQQQLRWVSTYRENSVRQVYLVNVAIHKMINVQIASMITVGPRSLFFFFSHVLDI